MGLQFTKSSDLQDGKTAASNNEIMEVPDKKYSVVEVKQSLEEQYRNTKEVDDLASTIYVSDVSTIVNFGKDAAEEISKCSDLILKNVDVNKIDDTGKLLGNLGKIMEKFDIKEISADEVKKGIMKTLFSTAQKQIEQMLAKYHTMGEEVDKIYVQLKEYEAEINESNKKLDNMYNANINYYQQLVKYILAGEQGLGEIDEYLTDMKAQLEQSNDNMLAIDVNNLEQAKELLEQRVQDLRIAENVAMQSLPMIKAMEYGNLNLIRKINSAFIITLPVFKQSLTQAILLKRQKIQAEAMKALDDKTNEMLIRNAENTVVQTKMTAQLASGSSIKIETLEKTWQTIMNGIDETRQITEQTARQREDDKIRLEKLKGDYENKLKKIM